MVSRVAVRRLDDPDVATGGREQRVAQPAGPGDYGAPLAQRSQAEHPFLTLQRGVGNAAVAALVQQGSVQRFSRLGHYIYNPARVSAGHEYVVGQDKKDMRAGTTAAAPRYTTVIGGAVTRGGRSYQKHKQTGNFHADCLHSAEEVMAQNPHALNPPTVRSQVHSPTPPHGAAPVTGQIGDTNRGNIELATQLKNLFPGQVDGAADPSVGQAFLIVEQSWAWGQGKRPKIARGVDPDHPNAYPKGPEGFPYHAAAVVAADGADRVTLEGIAGSSDAQDTDPREPGIFDIYTVGGGGDSFHGRHSASFDNPITIVIKP